MNELTIFNFKNNQVRTANIDNQPYFNLNDCCEALGIARGYKSAVRLSADGVRETSLIDNLGRTQVAKFINEPNLYRLIFRSNKPQAQAFADWVYNEVLPSIRKTGSYGVPSLTNDRAALKAIGGIVKKCAAVAVREELAALLSGDPQADWECSDQDLLYWLHRWHNTKNKADTLEFRRLHSENEELKHKLLAIKKAVN